MKTLLVLIFIFASSIAYAGPHMTGWIEHTEEQKQKVREEFKELKEIEKNDRALRRLKRQKFKQKNKKKFKEAEAIDPAEESAVDAMPDSEVFGDILRYVDNSKLPSFPPIR